MRGNFKQIFARIETEDAYREAAKQPGFDCAAAGHNPADARMSEIWTQQEAEGRDTYLFRLRPPWPCRTCRVVIWPPEMKGQPFPHWKKP